MCKVMLTVPSLAWLRRAVRRWRSRAAARPAEHYKKTTVPVPAGHVAVRVQDEGGAAAARFVVRVTQLSHPAFLELLRDAEEEYGFPSGASGPVALPCDEARLRDVLRRVCSSDSGSGSGSLCRRGEDCHSRRPLLGAMDQKLVS
ncbi:auxin-responsive protein SAUR36-like [Brachypodium distachyon]|uniref:auxin-responsive protein SAUR36-like n=1 Tax=Brachypodium distachyon TaxID=15368 RepID=UPI0001C705DB|nr:auxin-responsive protein SAUR36-like [Brachypodium distachyon]|eukprot:XP_014751012.1 auxin-responsive protein SAUR36-like [Brachypodium distachyon]